jgi:hypothetical protein
VRSSVVGVFWLFSPGSPPVENTNHSCSGNHLRHNTRQKF